MIERFPDNFSLPFPALSLPFTAFHRPAALNGCLFSASRCAVTAFHRPFCWLKAAFRSQVDELMAEVAAAGLPNGAPHTQSIPAPCTILLRCAWRHGLPFLDFLSLPVSLSDSWGVAGLFCVSSTGAAIEAILRQGGARALCMK